VSPPHSTRAGRARGCARLMARSHRSPTLRSMLPWRPSGGTGMRRSLSHTATLSRLRGHQAPAAQVPVATWGPMREPAARGKERRVRAQRDSRQPGRGGRAWREDQILTRHRSTLHPCPGAKYIQLTTFRRDGTAVSTPVHIVAGDTAFFRTWNVAGKAKRLRHAPAVQIAPSTFLAASRIADPGRGAPPRR
jgi:hypothetical protein